MGAWWLREEALHTLACSLKEQNFCVVDNFVDNSNDISLLRAAALENGASTPAPRQFNLLVECTDRLIGAIRESGIVDELHATKYISCALTRLAPGGFQGRHIDNPGNRQPARLTITYYMQSDDWDAHANGGCLQIFRPELDADGHLVSTASGHAGARDEDDVVAELAPVRDRLAVFFSNARCPHAVLPVSQDAPSRYTAVLFYGEVDYVSESSVAHEEEYTVDFSS